MTLWNINNYWIKKRNNQNNNLNIDQHSYIKHIRNGKWQNQMCLLDARASMRFVLVCQARNGSSAFVIFDELHVQYVHWSKWQKGSIKSVHHINGLCLVRIGLNCSIHIDSVYSLFMNFWWNALSNEAQISSSESFIKSILVCV